MTRFDPRKVSLHKSYTLKELSDLVGMSEKTCLRWIEQGLAIVPGSKKPILILGSEVKKFIRNRNSGAKIKLERHEFFCFKCKFPRRAKRGSISVSGNRKMGLCSACNGKMSKTIHPTKKDYKIPPTPIQMSIFS
jgi:hypothetical protein